MGTLNECDSYSSLYMLEQQLETLPRIFFRPEIVDVGQAVNTIGDAMEIRLPLSNLSEKEKAPIIARQVTETYNALKSCPEHSAAFAPLNKIANSIGANIINVFNVLRFNVKPEVDMLKDAIMGKTSEILSAENLQALVSPTAEPNTDFYQVPWDAIINIFGGASNVIQSFKDLTGYEPTFGEVDIRVALNTIMPTIGSLQIHPDTQTDILERVKQKTTNEVQANMVDEVYKLLTESYTFQMFVAAQLQQISNSNTYASILRGNIAVLTDVYPIVELFKTTPLDVSGDLLEKIQENIGVVLNVCRLIAYQVVLLRKFYNSALIIDAQTINPDTLTSFAESGGTPRDIAIYLQVFYTSKSIPVPNIGISGTIVLEQKESAEQMFATQNSSYLLNATTLRNGAMIRAAKEILSDHILAADSTRLPENVSIDEFYNIKKYLIQATLSRLDINDDNHLENSLYDFVIQLWYDKTMVQTAHELFGSEMVRQMSLNDNLSQEDLALVDARVAATIAARFILKELCTVA